MFETQDFKVREFVYSANEIVEYLKKLPPFGNYQGFPEDKIINLDKFYIPYEWQKQLLMQGFNSSANSPNGLIEFYKQLKTDK